MKTLIIWATMLLAAPLTTNAIDVNSLQSVEVGGAVIAQNSIVKRDNFNSVSKNWTLNFAWPNSVNSQRTLLAVFKGTFGAVDSDAMLSGVNYSLQQNAILAGSNSITKTFSLPALAATSTNSSSYTVVVAERSATYTIEDFLNWFKGAGVDVAPPEKFSMLSFQFQATSTPINRHGALNWVEYGGRKIRNGDRVYRAELNTSALNQPNRWVYNFTWDQSVSNQQALLMLFRGRFGSVDGVIPIEHQNYAHNLQAWSEGNSEIVKLMALEPLTESTTSSYTYTAVIAERDEKYLSEGVWEQIKWFVTGGVEGLPPRKYTTLEFDFAADDPYPVLIVPGILGSAERNGSWVLDPFLQTYNNLIDTLEANGYSSGITLFPFAYNWRLSNRETAISLKNRIDEIQQLCHCRMIDIVGHSMGGLVAREYIQSDYYEMDVNKVVFLGTPHLGAPKSYLTWEAGNTGLDSDPLSVLLKLILTLEAVEEGYANLFQYIQGAPIQSIKELLPSYSYLFEENDLLRVYPNNYPKNEFLDNLRTTTNRLFNYNVKFANIASDNLRSNTITSISVEPSTLLPLWPHGMPVNLLQPLNKLGVTFGRGDGTVPLESAVGPFENSLISSFAHGSLPSEESARVFELLTGSKPVKIIKRTLPSRLLIVQAFSPVDLIVTAPDGKQIGATNFNNTNVIPDSYYSGSQTNSEFIVVQDPLFGEYKIQSIGTDAGAYTISASLVTNENHIQSSASGTANLGKIHEFVADVGDVAISLTKNDESTQHTSIEILLPQPGSYLHSEVLATKISAINERGATVFFEIFWDGNRVVKDSIDLFFESLGPHTLTVESTNNDGSKLHKSVSINVIASIGSTLLDIQRAYSSDMIRRPAVKDDLVQRLKKVVQIENKIDKIEAQGVVEESTSKKLERLNDHFDNKLGKKMMHALEEHLKMGNLTFFAYKMISANVQWLIDNE